MNLTSRVNGRKRLRVFTGVCVLVFVLAGCGKAKPASHEGAHVRELLVAAAADLQFALPAVGAAFEKTHPETALKITFGASGALFAQIDNGAQFDVFLSADARLPAKLVESGKAAPGSDFGYALGRLVLWVAKTSKLDLPKLGLHALDDASVKKVAIANPAHAPYGAAAEAALRNGGMYEAVQPKLVLGENIAQAGQFVESGAADAGLIAHSLAQAPKMVEAGRYWEVPEDLYPPLKQIGAVLKGAHEAGLAQEFREFLEHGEGREILKQHGYRVP